MQELELSIKIKLFEENLKKSKVNKANLLRWRNALANPENEQTYGELYDQATGCMCVLGVGFREFWPNEFKRFVIDREVVDDSSPDHPVAYQYKFNWSKLVDDILETNDISLVTDIDFYILNDDGVTFEQFIEVFDRVLAD